MSQMAAEMLEHPARVVALQEPYAWIEAEVQSGCSSCSSNSCSTSVIASLFGLKRNRFRVENSIQAKVGDQVLIGIPSRMVAKASVFAYLLPLIAMLTLTFVSQSLQMSISLQSLSALAGLSAGLLAVRWLTAPGGAAATQTPQLLKVLQPGYHRVEFTNHIQESSQ
ncbi:MAG: SoxR reducing system RseC family protein [Candidatus Thiodiazotropha sp.]